MTTHVLRGSKQEIAERLVRITGQVREAIVFVEESPPAPAPAAAAPDAGDIFAEMQPFMVDVPDLDDSRDAIYSRRDGE
jgi:hypothetical protein